MSSVDLQTIDRIGLEIEAIDSLLIMYRCGEGKISI
jgi:hypothetical protein